MASTNTKDFPRMFVTYREPQYDIGVTVQVALARLRNVISKQSYKVLDCVIERYYGIIDTRHIVQTPQISYILLVKMF